jgi:peptidoglycan hydrolase-like protein with peptidoglycan-binding domain
VGNVSLSVSNVTKTWSGNWQKFIGGNGDLELDFSSLKGLNFYVPYIVENSNGSYNVKFMEINEDAKGSITLPNFRKDVNSLILMPSLQIKFPGFDTIEPSYPYNYTVKISGETNIDEQNLIQQFIDEIASLKKQIAAILEQRQGENGTQNNTACSQLTKNLYFGMSGNDDVKCLQQFLKNQGADIYPQGLVTGNFASLTRTAVIKFQEKYMAEILTPLGLLKGTGYVGAQTRAKINQILSGG